MVAWGYLVYAAIDFGSAARGGERSAWWLLALACLGAVACLFIGLMLVARALRELGVTPSPGTSDRPANTEETPEDAAAPQGSTAPTNPPRPSGGRRAAR
ncbi:hypothetical protein [Nocardioides insulae]|uniref:hypothetical protein n=1 Tax=Nocardioides insulae TaxID=394734 RepID=UPI000428C419|nr:hypothetical protein [Nocardioides insulae]